jgi:hypothetical protein
LHAQSNSALLVQGADVLREAAAAANVTACLAPLARGMELELSQLLALERAAEEAAKRRQRSQQAGDTFRRAKHLRGNAATRATDAQPANARRLHSNGPSEVVDPTGYGQRADVSAAQVHKLSFSWKALRHQLARNRTRLTAGQLAGERGWADTLV